MSISICPISLCSKKFKNETATKKHVKQEHSEGEISINIFNLRGMIDQFDDDSTICRNVIEALIDDVNFLQEIETEMHVAEMDLICDWAQ